MAKAMRLPLKDTAPMSAPTTARLTAATLKAVRVQQFRRGDGRGRATTHAVVERHHLRHGGHGHALAAPPGGARRR